jgi:hypothetical protein
MSKYKIVLAALTGISAIIVVWFLATPFVVCQLGWCSA